MIFHLALIVFVIGLVALVGGAAMLFHAYMEDIESDERDSGPLLTEAVRRNYANTRPRDGFGRVAREHPLRLVRKGDR